MFKNNHNRPNLAFIASAMLPWALPYGISNIAVEHDNWTFLHKSGID
jgi:hypothetical protein